MSNHELGLHNNLGIVVMPQWSFCLAVMESWRSEVNREAWNHQAKIGLQSKTDSVMRGE